MAFKDEVTRALVPDFSPICDDCLAKQLRVVRQRVFSAGRDLAAENKIYRAKGACSTCGKSYKWVSSNASNLQVECSPAMQTATAQQLPPHTRVTPSAWPQWDIPKERDLLRLARITIPYVRFLHPDIVKAVADDNEQQRDKWEAGLRQHGVDPATYIWERSACAFPGVRRHAGSNEIALHSGRMVTEQRPANALILDDNHYPKIVWSFVFRGRTFQNRGPEGYSLAHLADHKHYKNRGYEEFDNRGEATGIPALFGLFTSVANTVYLPTGLIRPTDFDFALRNVLQRRAEELYKDCCNVLPPRLSIRAAQSEDWALDDFEWSEPVGTLEHVSAFLSHRNAEMNKLLSS